MKDNWIYFQSKTTMQYQRPRPPADPLVNSMYQIDGAMRNILNREDLDEEEKLLLYDEKLRTYLNRYDKYRHPFQTEEKHKEDKSASVNEEKSASLKHILESVPKQVQPHSKLFLEKLKDVMSWNEKGEISFKGDTPIKGSNIIDLLGTAVRPHSLKNVSSSPVGMNTFIRGMREANIPRTWIRNKTIISRMHSTEESSDDEFATPVSPVKTGGFGTPSNPRVFPSKVKKWEAY